MRIQRYLGAFLLSGVLLIPTGLRADKHEKEKEHRYYHRESRDWHEWNEREEKAYHEYLKNERKREKEWQKSNRREQEDYWRWRHQHPDTILWPPVR
jgi:hypothetical protein